MTVFVGIKYFLKCVCRFKSQSSKINNSSRNLNCDNFYKKGGSLSDVTNLADLLIVKKRCTLSRCHTRGESEDHTSQKTRKGSTLALKPGQTSPEVQIRGISGPTKRPQCSPNIFLKTVYYVQIPLCH